MPTLLHVPIMLSSPSPSLSATCKPSHSLFTNITGKKTTKTHKKTNSSERAESVSSPLRKRASVPLVTFALLPLVVAQNRGHKAGIPPPLPATSTHLLYGYAAVACTAAVPTVSTTTLGENNTVNTGILVAVSVLSPQ